MGQFWRAAKRFTEDLNNAYPDVAYYRREVFQRDGSINAEWGSTYSGIDRLFTYCLADVVGERPACVQLQRQLESNKALHALGATFGEAPKDPKTIREKQAKAIDAELVLTEGAKGMPGAIAKADQIVASDPARYFMPQQFSRRGRPPARRGR